MDSSECMLLDILSIHFIDMYRLEDSLKQGTTSLDFIIKIHCITRRYFLQKPRNPIFFQVCLSNR